MRAVGGVYIDVGNKEVLAVKTDKHKRRNMRWVGNTAVLSCHCLSISPFK